MNYLDLFAGIGGFALGAYWAGWRFDAHYFSEVDPWAVDLYQKRFPDAIPLGDTRGIDGKALADANSGDSGRRADEQGRRPEGGDASFGTGGDWILTGGFPCQDISFAGKGAGLSGARSGLWWEYHRLISELRPRYAIVENVRALTVRGLDVVLGSLADIGYDTEWDCIRASDVGAPHRRERIWIVAYPAGANDQASKIAGGGASLQLGGGDDRKDVPDADNSSGTRRWPNAGMGTEQGNEREADSGTREGIGQWTIEPDVGRLAHGVPHRVDRLRGLGNAIVPQIAQLIFQRLLVTALGGGE